MCIRVSAHAIVCGTPGVLFYLCKVRSTGSLRGYCICREGLSNLGLWYERERGNYGVEAPKGSRVPGGIVVVVVFTLNRSFYPTTSPVPPVPFLILHPRELQILWSQTVRQRKTKRWRIKVGKSSASVPGTRARQTNKKRHQRNKSYEKKNTKRIKNKRIPRWGRVQMTQAEGTRTIKYVLSIILAESSRLLHRRRDTKKINIPGCREKKRK